MRETDVFAHVLPSSRKGKHVIEIEIVGDRLIAEIATTVGVDEDRVEIDRLNVSAE